MCHINHSYFTYGRHATTGPSWAPSQPHQKLTRAHSTCVLQHGCGTYRGKSPLPGKPTDRVTGTLFLLPLLPLFTLHWSAASGVQYNQGYTQTQWHCPQHGSLNNTGIRTLGKPTGFRQTALLPSLSVLFYFLIALPLSLLQCLLWTHSPFLSFSLPPSFSLSLSSLSLSLLVPRLSVLLKKFNLSLSCWNETNDKCSWRPPPTLLPSLQTL